MYKMFEALWIKSIQMYKMIIRLHEFKTKNVVIHRKEKPTKETYWLLDNICIKIS